MYKLKSDKLTDGTVVTNTVIRLSDNAFIPFDPANTDYQRFKSDILESKSELQDAEGNLLTPLEAKAYISTLP